MANLDKSVTSQTMVMDLPKVNGEPTLKPPINWLKSATIWGIGIMGSAPVVLDAVASAGVLSPSTQADLTQLISIIGGALALWGRWNGGKSLSPLKGTSVTR